MNSTFLVVVASAFFAACHSTRDVEHDLPFRTIVRGYQSGLAHEGVEVARSEGEWRALWNRHASSVIPRPDLPAVDFTVDMVVCVAVGPRPTFGYAIEIESIVSGSDRGLVIRALEKRPAPDAIQSQVMTQPFHMVATPKQTGKIRLVLR